MKGTQHCDSSWTGEVMGLFMDNGSSLSNKRPEREEVQ